MRMARMKADVTISVTGTDHTETLCPPMEVDLDRVLRPAKDAKGNEGDADFQPALAAFTVGDGLREDCYVLLAPPAPDSTSAAKVVAPKGEL